jgi:hypothetical protein
MTIRRINRNRNISIKVTDDEYKDFKQLQRYEINVSELVRLFVSKIANELNKFPVGAPPTMYINSLEEKLGVSDGRR